MLSLDFLVGFTIFLLALIMVVSMVPGLLAGLESSGIDYDAVAYRTGVILVEDPGWPVSPGWELIDAEHKDEIERMGLAVSRDAPNILLSTKIEKFFEKSPSGEPFFTEDDYRNKVIFGDIPYSYNISLRSLNDDTYRNMTGDPLPLDYGYIRRVVKIKEPSVAVIEGSKDIYWTEHPASLKQNFTVRLDFDRLLDPAISPAYRIDPRIEPVNVTITNFDVYRNGTESATLKSITFLKGDSSKPNVQPVPIPFLYDEDDTEYYTLHIDDHTNCYSPNPNTSVSSRISLVLKPAATSLLNLDQSSVLDIRFNFDHDPPQTHIAGIHYYDYNTESVTLSPLKTGVLEVAIW